MRKRAKVGDVVEITTPKGFAYAQYTHKHSMFGALLRVLPGTYNKRLQEFEDLLQHPVFSTFFPLQAAINKDIVTVIRNYPVPEMLREFPLFRVPMRDLTTGQIRSWWLWDGEREWPVGDLTRDQYVLPIREVINDTLLIERIVAGWTPEQEHG